MKLSKILSLACDYAHDAGDEELCIALDDLYSQAFQLENSPIDEDKTLKNIHGGGEYTRVMDTKHTSSIRLEWERDLGTVYGFVTCEMPDGNTYVTLANSQGESLIDGNPDIPDSDLHNVTTFLCLLSQMQYEGTGHNLLDLLQEWCYSEDEKRLIKIANVKGKYELF